MMSIMRDMPFIDVIAPFLLAASVWIGANVLYIAPNIIIPRMADNVWTPACNAGIQTANAAMEQQHQEEIAAFLAAKQAEKQQAQNMMTPLMQIMGEDFARSIGSQLNKGLEAAANFEIAQSMRDKFGSVPLATAAPENYCGCIISELTQDRIATGLYSASLRLWQPANIQQLNQLNKALAVSAQCNPKV